MQTNTTATLFHLSGGNWSKSNLGDVMWQERKASNVVKTGITNADSVVVFVPTESLEVTLAKDIIVKGECSLTIDNTSAHTQSNSLEAIMKLGTAHTITSCDECKYGSRVLWHYKLSCK